MFEVSILEACMWLGLVFGLGCGCGIILVSIDMLIFIRRPINKSPNYKKPLDFDDKVFNKR